MTTPPVHSHVIHPQEWLAASEKELTGLRALIADANDWAASHLALTFGIAWTIWAFMIYGLMGWIFVKQQPTLLYWSNWIQLWALPLFVFVGNKLQRTSDAQSDVQHQALTHIAGVGDDVKTLLQLNNDLTAEVHKIVKGSD